MSDPEDETNLPRLFTEEKYGEDGKKHSGKGRWAVLALTLTVLALGAVIWLGTASNGPQGSVPTITGAAGDYKKRPEDPGGRKIAHRESTVFRSLEAQGEASPEKDSPQKRIENLAAQDDGDGPLPKDRFYANLDTGMRDLAKRRDKTTQDTNDTTDTGGASTENAQRNGGSNDADDRRGEDTLEFVREVLEKKDEIEKKQRETDISQKGASAPQHYIQLGSFRKKSVATRAWQQARKKYSKMLEGERRNIQKADLVERGIYYRVRGGPVAQEAAETICRAIKKRDKNGCLIVSPDE